MIASLPCAGANRTLRRRASGGLLFGILANDAEAAGLFIQTIDPTISDCRIVGEAG
jgi:hypothetical protein